MFLYSVSYKTIMYFLVFTYLGCDWLGGGGVVNWNLFLAFAAFQSGLVRELWITLYGKEPAVWMWPFKAASPSKAWDEGRNPKASKKYKLYRKVARYQDCVECVPIPFMDIESWGAGAGDCLIVTFADLVTQPLKTSGSAVNYPPLVRSKAAEYRLRMVFTCSDGK